MQYFLDAFSSKLPSSHPDEISPASEDTDLAYGNTTHLTKEPPPPSDPPSQSSEDTHSAYEDKTDLTIESTITPSCASKVIATSFLSPGDSEDSRPKTTWASTTVPNCNHVHKETSRMFEPGSFQAAELFSGVFNSNMRRHLQPALLFKQMITKGLKSKMSDDELRGSLREVASNELYGLHESFFPNDVPTTFDVEYVGFDRYKQLAFPSALKNLPKRY